VVRVRWYVVMVSLKALPDALRSSCGWSSRLLDEVTVMVGATSAGLNLKQELGTHGRTHGAVCMGSFDQTFDLLISEDGGRSWQYFRCFCHNQGLSTQRGESRDYMFTPVFISRFNDIPPYITRRLIDATQPSLISASQYARLT
jgi:hypothetical protein